ncbi:MAG: DNA-3-methyladenine glycosylase [Pseudomonadales bacterium]|nr:DNA-3-methyladenine glycosylase [Pseudomonadales bacterium]
MTDLSLNPDFFDKPPAALAVALLGKVLRRKVSTSDGDFWLAARIIETEAYYLQEKGSHSSLGFTEKRKAMFMAPGTIYMYYARGGDSLNFSAKGQGNGVLIKSGFPWFDALSPEANLPVMQALNPGTQGPRPVTRLCNGQTLICKSLGLKVPDWNQQRLDPERFRLEAPDKGISEYIQTSRLGIPEGRDHHLPLRFIETALARHATRNPMTVRNAREGVDYFRRAGGEAPIPLPEVE